MLFRSAVITALAEQRLVDHRAGTGHGTVQLTRLGRQTVRAGRREPPRGRPPQHLLPGGAWSTLAQLYDAGDEGLDRSRYGGHHGSSSLVPLQAHRDGPLVEHFEVPQPIGQPTQRVRLTAAGRAFHQRAWAEHDRWYPGVRATRRPESRSSLSLRLAYGRSSTSTWARRSGRQRPRRGVLGTGVAARGSGRQGRPGRRWP